MWQIRHVSTNFPVEPENINTIIGGLHLINTPKEKMDKIIGYLKSQNIKEIYPCHCTDFNARVALANKLNVKEAGVGLILNF